MGQVSPNFPPVPLPLVHLIIHPSPLPPFASPLHSHNDIATYTHHLPCYILPGPQLHFFLSFSPPPPFPLFALFMAIHLLPAPLPTFTHHIRLFPYAPWPLDYPSLPLPPPLIPHFRFFGPIYGCPPPSCMYPSPSTYHSIVFPCSLPLDDPSCPPALPAPSPSPPIFAF